MNRGERRAAAHGRPKRRTPPLDGPLDLPPMDRDDCTCTTQRIRQEDREGLHVYLFFDGEDDDKSPCEGCMNWLAEWDAFASARGWNRYA